MMTVKTAITNKLPVALIGAALIALGSGGAAKAATLGSGGWTSFSFGGPSSPSNPSTFDFTSAAKGDILKITDAFLKGDVFKVFDSGVLLGLTSFVPASTSNTTFDPDTAFADSTYSKGIFSLAPGSHSISIITESSPFGSGGAYIRRDPNLAVPVPTPALLPGLIGMGIAAYRKRKGEGVEQPSEA